MQFHRSLIFSECENGNERLICLTNCSWKSLPGRRCPRGKQCCFLKPRRVLYQSIRDSTRRSNFDEQSHTDNGLQSFTNVSQPKRAVRHPWKQIRRSPSKISYTDIQNPWVLIPVNQLVISLPEISNDIDNDIRPISQAVQVQDTAANVHQQENVHEDGVSRSTTATPKTSSDKTKILLDTSQYIKPTLKSFDKSTSYSRKSVKCELKLLEVY